MKSGEEIRFGSFVEKYYTSFCFYFRGARAVWVYLGDTDFEWHDYEMISVVNDIWETKIGKARAGMQYKYKIELEDGSVIFKNDPYARQLTNSKDGASVIVSDKFNWRDDAKFKPAKRAQQVIYELHVGTFNKLDEATPGTFYTVVEKLDYLKELGINMIEVMPVTSMYDGVGWGYNPTHLFSVEENYGGAYGFKYFVQAAHERGIAVLLDLVYNHYSLETDLPDFYFAEGDLRDTPWGPRLNFADHHVQNYLIDNIRMWGEEYHVDGLRLDSTILIRSRALDNDSLENAIPESWNLLQKINRSAQYYKRNIFMVAEDTGVNNYLTKPISEEGAGFIAQWDLEFPTALRQSFGITAWQNFDYLIKVLQKTYNGDWRERIIFSESHDTAAISNGHERLHKLFDGEDSFSKTARQKMLLSTGLILTAPGVPMLFQGQESMQFSDFSALTSFNWDLTTHFSDIVLAHKHLVDLRLNKHGNTAGLTEGEINIFHVDNENKVLAYARGNCVIIANFGDQSFDSYDLYLPFAGQFIERFNSSWSGYGVDFPDKVIGEIKTSSDNKIAIPLPETTFIILSQ